MTIIAIIDQERRALGGVDTFSYILGHEPGLGADFDSFPLFGLVWQVRDQLFAQANFRCRRGALGEHEAKVVLAVCFRQVHHLFAPPLVRPYKLSHRHAVEKLLPDDD
jgi:hypothetical protein